MLCEGLSNLMAKSLDLLFLALPEDRSFGAPACDPLSCLLVVQHCLQCCLLNAMATMPNGYVAFSRCLCNINVQMQLTSSKVYVDAM